MTTKRKTYDTLSEALCDAIAETEHSFKGIERETGVARQSLMRFFAGEQSLRLDMADKLIEFFGIEIYFTRLGMSDRRRVGSCG